MNDGMKIIADRWMLESRQIVNWGSYDGYHEFRPSTDDSMPVTLLAGASESGKSTLVDAQISLLYPTGTPYNKASNTGRSERNDYTYLRGMLGVENTESGDEPIYLRGRGDDGMPRPVWGAIVDTYMNRTGGEVLSCAKFLYLAPGDGRADVRRQYAVWNRVIDPRLMDRFRDSPFTAAMLRATYPGSIQFSNADAFHAHIWQAMGLDESACRLLYKIQSADAPSRLDDIFKQGVLGVPEAIELAKAAVEDYDRYDANFRSMEEKAKRVARLRDVRDAYDAYEQARREVKDYDAANPATDSGSKALDSWARSRMAVEVSERLPLDERRIIDKRRDLQGIKRQADDLRQRVVDVSALMDNTDGADLARLETRLGQARHDAAEVRERRRRMERLFDEAGETMPDGEDEWGMRRDAIVSADSAYADDVAESERSRDDAVAARAKADHELAQLQRDYERQSIHRTRITQQMDEARALIARATGLDVDELPYVAELMDVREGSEQWRDAMNVVYGSMAQTILVDKRHEQGFAEKVSAIDPRRMMRRTWRFVDTERDYGTDYSPGWMSEKLRYREDSPFVGWLRQQTASERLDARCVDVIDDADRDTRQIQMDGQIKSGSRGQHGTRGVTPVIGFVNESYLQRLRDGMEKAKARLAAVDDRYHAARSRIERLSAYHALAEALAYTTWSSIDVVTAERHVASIESDIEQARHIPELERLSAEKTELESRYDETNRRLYRMRSDIEALQRTVDASKRWLDSRDFDADASPASFSAQVLTVLNKAYEDNFAGVVDPSDRPHIIVGANGGPGATFERRALEHIHDSMSRLINGLESTADIRRAAVESAMSAYLEYYARDDDALNASVDDYRFYLDELHDLERLTASAATTEEYANCLDKLLMDFTQINRAIDTDARDIDDQLGRINAMLKNQRFGPRHGSLSIGADVRAPERSFGMRLRRIIASLQSWRPDTDATAALDAARRTFASCDGMVMMLRQELGQIRDANGIKSYGARNLDPRCRSSFYATVHHVDAPDERITSTGGKSGGALQELTSFVYGAALIYLLGGDVSGRPTYTTLFLDEALIKADGRYTQRALAVLPRLGFQVIVSAPESKTAEILEIATRAYVAYRNPNDGRSYLQEASLNTRGTENEPSVTA
ncbi:ATP-binding protein [Bifidobacterium catulorum]|uniref:P-loop containing region of AAA domain-containing protein n=1 Tax=Bifidobacterium catulorum TaxID=1630173 RepID=A0A2U2MV29_9BIFI|nr:ATP-binding protein [Bifidobacterium catulorum]PWG60723.1 hypothetical protein DF200_00330 [Bifidobacterium catulorum]